MIHVDMRTKEKEMSKENPYEVGDQFLTISNGIGGLVDVLAVNGPLVAVSYIDDSEGFGQWLHFKETEGRGFTPKEPNTWKDLTEHNWKERRDKAVWCKGKDGDSEFVVEKLIGFEPSNAYPFIVVNRNGVSSYKKVSIYNSNGEKATI